METNRINPGGQKPDGSGESEMQPEEKLMAINIVEIVSLFARSLNDSPVEVVPHILTAICGSIAENVTHDTWQKLLAIKAKPCGDPGCECHIYTDSFLTELHNLKVVADKGKERIRNEQGRGLN